MYLNILTRVVQLSLQSNFRTFSSPPKRLQLIRRHFSIPSNPLATGHLATFCLYWFAYWDILHEWNHIICDILWLACFPSHNVFKIYPGSMYKYFTFLLLNNILLWSCHILFIHYFLISYPLFSYLLFSYYYYTFSFYHAWSIIYAIGVKKKFSELNWWNWYKIRNTVNCNSPLPKNWSLQIEKRQLM